MLRIVAATRLDRASFRTQALLGRSLDRLIFRKGVELRVTFSNSVGLPDLYNAALAESDDADVMVFTHDDVCIDDWFVSDRLTEALERFAVVGVAGNRRRLPGQPSWIFADTSF